MLVSYADVDADATIISYPQVVWNKWHQKQRKKTDLAAAKDDADYLDVFC